MTDKKKSRVKAAAILGAVLLFITVAVFFVLGLFLTRPRGEDYLRGLVERNLERVLGGDVSLGSLETNLVSRLYLERVEISREAKGEQVFLLRFHSARINYRPWQLIGWRPFISSVVVDRLHLSLNQECRDVAADSPSEGFLERMSGDVPLKLPVRIGTFSLRNGSMTYVNRCFPVESTLQDIAIDFEERDDGTCLLKVRGSGGDIAFRQSWYSLESMYLDGVVREGMIRIDNLMVKFPDMECTLASSIDSDTDAFPVEGSARIRGNPGFFVAVARDLYQVPLVDLGGDIELNIGLTGTILDPRIVFRLSFPEVIVYGLKIENGVIEGTGTAEIVRITDMAMDVLEGHVAGRGEIVFDDIVLHRVALEVADVDMAETWSYFFHEPSAFDGRARGMISLEGSLKNVESTAITAELALSDVTYNAVPQKDMNARISYDRGLCDIEIKQADSRIRATVQLHEETITGDFDVSVPEMNLLTEMMSIHDLSGSLEARGRLMGTVGEPEITADIVGRSMRFMNFPVDSLKGRIVFTGGELTFEDMSIVGGPVSIETFGFIPVAEDMNGELVYRMHLNGSLDDPKGTVSLQIVNPRYRGKQFDRADLMMTVDEGQTVLDFLHVRKDSLMVEVTGSGTIPSFRELAHPGKPVAETAQAGISGNLRAALYDGIVPVPPMPDDTRMPPGMDEPVIPELEVPAEDGAVLPASDQADDERATGGRTPPDSGIEPTIAGSRMLGKLTASFDMRRPGHWLVEAHGEGIDIPGISALFPGAWSADGIGGVLRCDLQLTGIPERPAGNLDFTVDTPRYNGVLLDSLGGTVRIDRNRLSLDSLVVSIRGNDIRARAEVERTDSPDGFFGITSGSSTRGRIEGDNIDLEFLQPLLETEIRYTARSSFSIGWEGALGRPLVRGGLSIDGGEITVNPDSTPIEDIAITASFRDSVFVIERAGAMIGDVSYLLQSDVTMSNPDEFHLNVRGFVDGQQVLKSAGNVHGGSLDIEFTIDDLSLAVLEVILPGVENIGGVINSGLKVGGTVFNPQVFGKLQIDRFTFVSPRLMGNRASGAVFVAFDGNRALLDSLVVHLNEGMLVISGDLEYGGGEIGSLDLSAVGRNLAFNSPGKFNLRVDSVKATCRKEDFFYNLEGEVVLGDSRIVYNLKPQDFVAMLKKTDRSTGVQVPFLEKIQLNILVRGNKPFWVDNNLARFSADQQIKLIGTVAHPKIDGWVTLNEGYVLFLDRKFKVLRGIVHYTDTAKMDPHIDFTAETTIRSFQALAPTQYRITLAVNGRLTETGLTMSSEPLLDQADIMSLLIMGVTREQLAGTTDEMSVNDIFRERLKAFTNQRINSYVAGRVGNLFGLDSISIEGNLFNFGNSWGPELLASEKLSDRMEITYTANVGQMNEQSVRLDYRLTNKFSLQGQTDQRGRTGFDVKYRLRFK